jgi:hypothetical protein
MGRGLRSSEEVSLSLCISLSQTSKNTAFLLLSFVFSLQQNWRTREQNRFDPKAGWEGGGGPNNEYT